MIKAIIIDDEKHCLVTLEYLLKSTKQVEILRSIQKSSEAEQAIKDLKPDLVFIDIEMPQLNGFEVLNRFHHFPFRVIFTTAYNQYAIRALKMNALDYLLKPISLEDIEHVLEKYRSNSIEVGKNQISNLYQFSQNNLQDTIALSVHNGLVFVKIEEIVYIEACGSYSNIVMKNNSQHVVSKNLSIFEDVLTDYTIFFRPGKSFIVNLKYVKQYIRGIGGEIIMIDGKNISISRGKKQDFLSLFHKI